MRTCRPVTCSLTLNRRPRFRQPREVEQPPLVLLALLLLLFVRGILLWLAVPIAFLWWGVTTLVQSARGKQPIGLGKTIGWADLKGLHHSQTLVGKLLVLDRQRGKGRMGAAFQVALKDPAGGPFYSPLDLGGRIGPRARILVAIKRFTPARAAPNRSSAQNTRL